VSSDKLEKTALILEAAVLPVLYGRRAFACGRAALRSGALLGLVGPASAGHALLQASLTYAADCLQIAYWVAVVVVLLRAKKSAANCDRPSHLLLPLANILMGLSAAQMIAFLDWLPVLDATPVPVPGPIHLTGLGLCVAGRLLSTIGVLSLGSSFGVFIELKGVVREGVYRYLNHPIYLGYSVSLLGGWLGQASSAVFAFCVIQIAFLAWRAALENRLLAAYRARVRAPAEPSWRPAAVAAP